MFSTLTPPYSEAFHPPTVESPILSIFLLMSPGLFNPDGIQMAIRLKSPFANENTKRETHQSKSKYSFEVSIHTNSKTTDMQNEITRNG